MENKVIRDNGLSVLVDWIGFTVLSLSVLDDILSLFGLSRSDFSILPHGSNGYKSCILYNGCNIRVSYDGNENMGVHFDISGSGVSCFLELYKQSISYQTPFGPAYNKSPDETILCSLFRSISSVGKLTRLDLAVDDIGCKYFSCDDIENYYQNDQIRSRFSKHQHIYSDSDHVKTGDTIYFGSRKSDVFLRIYDKQLEQSHSGNPFPAPWIRYEFELKAARAIKFAEKLCNQGGDLGSCVMALFHNYFNIVEKSDSNISRCPAIPLWNDFLSCVGKLQLSIPRPEASLDEKEAWINRQVLPTITALLVKYGNFDFLQKDLVSSLNRLRKNKPLCTAVGGEVFIDELIEYYAS